MNKQLPKPKKTLKTFILENDAKITDKTAAKIAITASFIALNLVGMSEDANAKGHNDHNDHSNRLNVDSDYGTNYHVGNNFEEEEYPGTEIAGKTVQTAHANHYNHKDGGGQGGCSDGFQDSSAEENDPNVASKAIMPADEINTLKETEVN